MMNFEDKTLQTIAFRQRPEDFRVIGDRYLVEDVDMQHVSPGGLVLPELNSMTAWQAGKVLAVGDGRRLGDSNTTWDMTAKVGDIVVFERLSGREVPMGGRQCRILSQTAVFGIFTAEVVEGNRPNQ